MSARVLLPWLVLASACTDDAAGGAAAGGPGAAPGRVRQLSEVEIDPELLPGLWTVVPGLALDSWDDAAESDTGQAELLRRQLGPHGCCGAAMFGLAQQGAPGDHVMVRVLVFTDEAMCQRWKTTQYLDRGLDLLLVSHGETEVFDVNGASKRVVFADNRCIEAQHVRPGDAHLRLLEHVARQIGVEL